MDIIFLSTSWFFQYKLKIIKIPICEISDDLNLREKYIPFH